MSATRMIFPAALAAAFAGAGAWVAQSGMGPVMLETLGLSAHKHRLEQKTDAQGKVYYTCSMHPQVRQDEPGHCPICGMKLVKREEATMPASSPSSMEKKVLYWYDPMTPDQHFDAPGKSPFMDMQLVPKYSNDDASGTTVAIDPRVTQNLGLRTAPAELISLAGGIEATGNVAADERRLHAVVSRAAGFVERLDVRAVGEPVQRGQVIAGVYAPELYAAQQEFLLARKGEAALANAARERLKLLGMSEAQIAAVADSGQAQRQVLIVAPVSGVVSELNAREGGQTEPGMPLMRISDLSRVWIQVEIPEAQASAVRQGLGAEARLAGLPGRVFEGRVDYIYPSVDMTTRTLRARLTFDNPGLALKPGMYASIALAAGGRTERIVVPSEAVIRTGKRDVVIVAESEGRFRPQEVRVGREAEGRTEILEGIRENENVVVSGQFLIDSEANLQGVLSRLSGETK